MIAFVSSWLEYNEKLALSIKPVTLSELADDRIWTGDLIPAKRMEKTIKGKDVCDAVRGSASKRK